ncbi:MAG TPA: helix-turn-helix domain-containing protein [Dehalococcoidia bacterium]|nr:helix-turn-helix domain-containing protein [Dehalococcoidia bacterium]
MEEPFVGFISTKEAAARAGLDVTQIRLLARTGKLKGVKAGRDWFIAVAALEEYVATRGWHKARWRKKRTKK